MNILVVGAGALGGYFGGRLLQAGRKVTFLLRLNRIKQLEKTGGLVVKSAYSDFTIADLPYITTDQIKQPYDLVILSCKAYSLEDCMNDIAPTIGENTMILPVLNGLSHVDKLCKRFGKQHILGGKVFMSATLDNEGRILHVDNLHTLGYGELDGSLSPRIEEVNKQLSDARFNTDFSAHILQDMWEKWIFIATAAGMTCLMRAALGDIVKAGGAYLSEALFDECCDIAAHNGVDINTPTLQKRRSTLADSEFMLMASMLKDLEKGYKIESEAIIGDFINKAPKGSANNYPLLKLVYVHLNSYQIRYTHHSL